MTKKLLGELELNRIYQRDCIEGLRLIPGDSVDIVVIDPPYKIEAGGGNGGLRSGIFHRNKGNRQLFNYESASRYMHEISRVVKGDSHVYVFTNDKNLNDMISEAEKFDMKLMNILVLDKGNKVAFGWYMKQLEFVCLFRSTKGRAKQINNMSATNLIPVNFPKGKSRVHPSEKSIEIIQQFIEQSSNEGDVVLDCFIGSGTTAVAAIRTNRYYIGFELEKEYIDLANRRLNLEKGGSANG